MRLRQVLFNVVGKRASKFTREGQVKIRAWAEPVGRKRDAAGSLPAGTTRMKRASIWSLEVSDTGIGIPKAQQEPDLRRVPQVAGPEHAQVYGTGLGLTITKRLTEMMRGRDHRGE